MARGQRRQLRYIEISARNPVTRILIGTGSQCGSPVSFLCDEVCIEIKRAGHGSKCPPKVKYNACCQEEVIPDCDLTAGYVCATEIDEDGYAVFVWPKELFNLKEGWYEGHVKTGCNTCKVLPLRVGPRCNVLDVEYVVAGPDTACYVGCDETCPTEICPTTKVAQNSYIPDYLRN